MKRSPHIWKFLVFPVCILLITVHECVAQDCLGVHFKEVAKHGYDYQHKGNVAECEWFKLTKEKRQGYDKRKKGKSTNHIPPRDPFIPVRTWKN